MNLTRLNIYSKALIKLAASKLGMWEETLA